MKTSKRKFSPQMRRIYSGPPGHVGTISHLVKCRDAKTKVTINGSVEDVLKAHPGVTVGCALSNAAVANAQAFPHPVILAYFTRSTVLVVDTLNKHGHPTTAVRYAHPYNRIVDLNDKRTLKTLVKENPTIIVRQFELRPPRVRVHGTGTHKPFMNVRTVARAFLPRGAMSRAIKAGLMSAPYATQISQGIVAASAAALGDNGL